MLIELILMYHSKDNYHLVDKYCINYFFQKYLLKYNDYKKKLKILAIKKLQLTIKPSKNCALAFT